MSSTDLGKFSCSACNRQYPWKPEYAGRKVKCKCGSVITAPAEAPNAQATEEEDDLLGGLYDLAAQEQQAARTGATTDAGMRCPSCQNEIEPGAAVCPYCSFNLRTKSKAAAPRPAAAAGGGGGGAGNPMLAYAGMGRKSQADARADSANSMGGSLVRELYVPAGLVVLGLLGQIFFQHRPLPVIGLMLTLNLVISFIGVAIVAKIFEIGFGAPGPAVLKMVAICLVPSAIAQAIGNVVGADSSFVRLMVPAMLIIPLALVMFVLLFDLGMDEAIYTSAVIYLVDKWVVMLLLGAILVGGFSFGGGHSMSKATADADEEAAEMIERPNATEARSWLGASGNRMYSGETHDSSEQLVASFYDAGAKRVTTMSSSGEGYAMIIQLPSKTAARERVFAAIHKYEESKKTPKEDQTEDEGQDYHTIRFSPEFKLQ